MYEYEVFAITSFLKELEHVFHGLVQLRRGSIFQLQRMVQSYREYNLACHNELNIRHLRVTRRSLHEDSFGIMILLGAYKEGRSLLACGGCCAIV